MNQEQDNDVFYPLPSSSTPEMPKSQAKTDKDVRESEYILEYRLAPYPKNPCPGNDMVPLYKPDFYAKGEEHVIRDMQWGAFTPPKKLSDHPPPASTSAKRFEPHNTMLPWFTNNTNRIPKKK